MGNISFTKKKKKKEQGAKRRLDSGGSRYKLDSGWDSGRYRGLKFFVVWDGATVIGSVSKTKTHVITSLLCSFSSFQTPADTSNIHQKA